MVAGLSSWHSEHAIAAPAIEGVTVLPAHVLLEAYAVLTRLPGGLAVPAPVAADVLARRFPDPPLRLERRERSTLVRRLAAAGVAGGSAYDGLVGLEAAAHQQALLTLDRRALTAYRALDVPHELLGG